jgi:ADP-ribose pyrophosphatase
MKQVLDKNRVYNGFLNIDVLDIELSSGLTTKEEVMVRKNASAALVYDLDNDTFVLAKQFRAGSESELVEIVAGSIEPGESPVEGIEREVLEEIGYTSENIKHLHSCYVSPGGCSEMIHIYYIEGRKVANGGGVDAQEEIEVINMSLSEMKRFNFEDAKTIIAIQSFLINHNGNKY